MFLTKLFCYVGLMVYPRAGQSLLLLLHKSPPLNTRFVSHVFFLIIFYMHYNKDRVHTLFVKLYNFTSLSNQKDLQGNIHSPVKSCTVPTSIQLGVLQRFSTVYLFTFPHFSSRSHMQEDATNSPLVYQMSSTPPAADSPLPQGTYLADFYCEGAFLHANSVLLCG